MLEAGAAYLRVVGPTYGFFGLGLSLYFASQGAGRLAWPLLGGLVRLLVAVGGGWLVLDAHRLARLGVRRAGAGARGLRRDRRGGGRLGRLVPAQVIALGRESLVRAAAGRSPAQDALRLAIARLRRGRVGLGSRGRVRRLSFMLAPRGDSRSPWTRRPKNAVTRFGPRAGTGATSTRPVGRTT